MLSVRLGARNLARHRWRTGLTLAGIGVSVALMVWTVAFMDGWMDQMVVAATSVDTGQLEVQTAGWADKPRPYESLAVNDSLLDVIRSVPGVAAASPRVELYGLVGHERRSQVTRILGVDPDLEANATPIVKGIREGRWLDEQSAPVGEGREVVLGSGLAKQLEVGPGAELVVFAEAADGSLGNDLLQVVGVVETGNSAIDRGAVYLNIADARFLAALEGRANAILVRTDNPEQGIEVSDALAARLGALRDPEGAPPEAVVVRSWQELIPSLYQVIAMSKSSYWTMYMLIYLVAAVGILNTQRMSALERRREFGVLIAIGMRPRRLFRTVLVESVVLGFAGSMIGAILGGAVSWYHATAGFDLSMLTRQGSGFSYMGVAFTDRLYASITVGSFVQPVVVMLLVAVLSGLWPAWTAARLQPAPTIAGRT
ncbi:MAG: ABC transporter permease [Gemmatimonadota bacterium]|jgi:ABC-type lipoprotein release transport system permease subunit